jgi:hypothetical protein
LDDIKHVTFFYIKMMDLFWSTWNMGADSDGTNIVKISIPQQNAQKTQTFNDDGYRSLIHGYVNLTDEVRQSITLHTIVLSIDIVPVFTGYNAIRWDGIMPYIEGDAIYYFGLTKTMSEIESFGYSNALKPTGKVIQWPRYATELNHYMFSISRIITKPVFPQEIMTIISDTNIATYIESIDLPDDEHAASMLKVAILRELYCTMEKRKFNIIERVVLSDDRKMDEIVSRFPYGWESCPYTHSLIDRYIMSKSEELYDKLTSQDIITIISNIKLYYSGSDHNLVAQICAVMMRKDYIYNVDIQKWMRFNEHTKDWDIVAMSKMTYDVCVVLKEILIKAGKAISNNLYDNFKTSLDATGVEIRTSIESMLKHSVGKDTHAFNVIKQMNGMQSMNMIDAFNKVKGITKTNTTVIDFTTGCLVLRDAVREDMISRNCRTRFHEEELVSLGCAIQTSITLDPISESDRELDNLLPRPRYQPTFVKLTDIPLFVMCLQMFWREDLEVSREIVCELWKCLAIPFTRDLAKEIINITGPKAWNGKSTLIKILKEAVGKDHYGDISLGVLRKESDGHGATSGFAPLANAYYAIIAESDATKPVLSHVVKHITGGDDFTMREIYEKTKTVPLNCSLLSSGNSPLSFDSVDFAIRQRTYYFIAMGQYSPDAPKSKREQWETGLFEIDRSFGTSSKKIREYAEQALLLLAYFGQKYMEEGLQPNRDMEYYKDYYLSSSNPQIMFISECLEPNSDSIIPIHDIYGVFVNWFGVKYLMKQIAPNRDAFVSQLMSSFPGSVTLSDVIGIGFTHQASAYNGDLERNDTLTRFDEMYNSQPLVIDHSPSSQAEQPLVISHSMSSHTQRPLTIETPYSTPV